MAYLVCYSQNPPDDHTQKTALYLDQKFYAMIFVSCRTATEVYPILSKVASMRYKSPTLTVENSYLPTLESELDSLEASGQQHPQIKDLKSAIRRAKVSEFALTISGDMYPEL